MLNTVFKKKVSVDLSWTPRLQGRRLDRLSIPSVPWGKSSQLCEPLFLLVQNVLSRAHDS